MRGTRFLIRATRFLVVANQVSGEWGPGFWFGERGFWVRRTRFLVRRTRFLVRRTRFLVPSNEVSGPSDEVSRSPNDVSGSVGRGFWFGERGFSSDGPVLWCSATIRPAWRVLVDAGHFGSTEQINLQKFPNSNHIEPTLEGKRAGEVFFALDSAYRSLGSRSIVPNRWRFL